MIVVLSTAYNVFCIAVNINDCKYNIRFELSEIDSLEIENESASTRYLLTNR